MKVNENDLRNILRLAITDVNNSVRPVIEQFKTLMWNMYNFTGGESVDILTGKLPVELMQKETLFRVTKVLYELNNRTDATFDKNKLDLDKYFTEKEKTELDVKIDRKIQDEDIVIKAGNWIQVEEDQYIIKIYVDELLNEYINRNKINYNPETQRDLTIKETKTGIVKTITFDPNAFEDICANMENNLYISDMLALNVNPDYYEPPKIVRGNIVIPKDSRIDCIDGYHRLKSAITTKLRNPNWNKPLIFFLFTCDVSKAVRYILQQDKKIHLTEAQTVKVDQTDAANFIIKKLCDSNNFYLRNNIDDKMKVSLNKIISQTFNTKKLYTNEDRKNAVELYTLIEKNINLLMENLNLYDKDFSPEEWFIYLFTLKHCTDNNIDFISKCNKLNLEELLQQISFVNKPVQRHYNILREVMKNV